MLVLLQTQIGVVVTVEIISNMKTIVEHEPSAILVQALWIAMGLNPDAKISDVVEISRRFLVENETPRVNFERLLHIEYTKEFHGKHKILDEFIFNNHCKERKEDMEYIKNLDGKY